MNYETFMKEKDRIAELPDEEQKRFMRKYWKKKRKTAV